MTPRPRLRHGLAVLGAGLLALAACTAFAGAPATGSSRRPAAATTPAASPQKASPAPSTALPSLSLMAFLDPETGQLTGPISYLVPPADQRAANASVLLTPVQTRSGGWLMDLKGTGMESYVLQIDLLGNRRVVCVQDPMRVPLLLPMLAPPAGEER